MPVYICEKCKKEFKQKSNYEYHIHRKNSCLKLDEPIKFICPFCNHDFTKNSSLKRHLEQNCSNKPTKTDTINLMQKQILQMQEEIKKLNENNKTEINNNKTEINNNTYNNTINFNFNQNAFGKENYDYISDSEFRNILSKGLKSIFTLIKRLHFDKDHPENHNIYIPNFSNGYLLMYDGDDWNIVENNDGLTHLFENGTSILEKKHEQMFDKLDDYAKGMFAHLIDARDEDTPAIKGIKKELKALLYNKRNIAISTKKKNPKSISS